MIQSSQLVAALWFRIWIAGCAVGFLVVAFGLLQRLDGLLFYETIQQIAFEAAVQTYSVVILATVAATIASFVLALALLSPSLKVLQHARAWIAPLTLLSCSSIILHQILQWAINFTNLIMPTWAVASLVALGCGYLAYAVAWPLYRRDVADVMGSDRGQILTRRTVLAAGAATVAMVSLGPGEIGRNGVRHLDNRGRRSNILLVTFDSLSADDMSLYGHELPTTPQIDAFARSATVFTNVISCSTFTTPCVASLLTGRYPSEHGVYQLGGILHGDNAARTLPRVLREAGYLTAASVANIYAHPAYALGIAADFDFLPAPPLTILPLTNAGQMLHTYDDFQKISSGLRDVGHLLVRDIPNRSINQIFAPDMEPLNAAPELSFRQGLALLQECRTREQPFFLWIHLVAPHNPYAPRPPFRDSFAGRDMTPAISRLTGPNWEIPVSEQPDMKALRRRYGEWLRDADAALGTFLAEDAVAQTMDDTAIILSADHGESFHGVFAHGSPFQARGEIHIPLLIRRPRQANNATISHVVDQTMIAPAILDLTGVSAPDWMRSSSALVGQGHNKTVGFSQYLERSSAFHPPRRGSLSVVDGEFQYVAELSNGANRLRRWAMTDNVREDISDQHPDVAAALRQRIIQRFPTLLG